VPDHWPPAIWQKLSSFRPSPTLFRLIMRFVRTQRSQNDDMVRAAVAATPLFSDLRSPATICTRRTRIVRPQLQTTTATPKQIIKRCSGVLMFNDTKLCLYVLLDGCVVPPRRCRSCNSYPGVYTTTRRNTDWSLQPTIGLISLQRQSKTRQLTAYC